MSQEKLDHVVAGAIFDFMGWLTTRQEKLVLSSADDAAPAAKAVKEFLTMRGVPQGWKLVQIELLERIQESLLWLGRLKTLYLKGKKSASGGLTTIPLFAIMIS